MMFDIELRGGRDDGLKLDLSASDLLDWPERIYRRAMHHSDESEDPLKTTLIGPLSEELKDATSAYHFYDRTDELTDEGRRIYQLSPEGRPS